MSGHGGESGTTRPLGKAGGGQLTDYQEQIAEGMLRGKSLAQIGRERDGIRPGEGSSRQSSHNAAKQLLANTGFPEYVTPGSISQLAINDYVMLMQLIKPGITYSEIMRLLALSRELPPESREEIHKLAIHSITSQQLR